MSKEELNFTTEEAAPLVAADPPATTDPKKLPKECTEKWNMAECFRLTKGYEDTANPWYTYYTYDTNLINWGVPFPIFWDFTNIDKFEWWSNILDYKPFQAIVLFSMVMTPILMYLSFFFITTSLKDSMEGWGWTAELDGKVKELKY